jgi:F-type H+-transporting ATPase subunit gamma
LATQREILKRIKSVSSTKKITKTMEMISTSKMKKMQGRLVNSKPYEEKLEQIIGVILDSEPAVIDESWFKSSKIISKKLILMITGNRGLCGGYNTNVIKDTISFRDKLIREENTDVLLRAIGKKGINYFKFINLPMQKSEINLEDKITFKDAEKLGIELSNLFKSEEVNEIFISYTKMVSSASYKPAIYRLLPLSIDEIGKAIPIVGGKKFRGKYIFEPDPNAMLSSFIPQYISLKLYINLMESGYAEQNARRAAMKNATDAANEMVRNLTVKYNRARQAKITNEIAEIVGGAAALE